MTTEDICRVCDYEDKKQEEWNRRHLKALAWGLLLSLPFWLGVARMWHWI